MRWHDAVYGERHMPNVQINQSSMMCKFAIHAHGTLFEKGGQKLSQKRI